MSDSLRPHGLQHARPPGPSPTPGVYSNSCPLSWWCHPTISSSLIPFSSCLQSLMWRTDSLGKTLMLGKIESGRRRGWRRMRWLGGIINLMAMRLGKFQELVIYREAWRAAVHEASKSRTWLSDWTDWTETETGRPTLYKWLRHLFTVLLLIQGRFTAFLSGCIFLSWFCLN